MENKCEFTFKDLNGNAGKIVKYENINLQHIQKMINIYVRCIWRV
ncbi:MAG: hypothetical protein SOY54_04150 [Bacilli bacterium]|nr:hypothetical protein [Bacilli bacterium]